MSGLWSLDSYSSHAQLPGSPSADEYVLVQRSLHRVLAFIGHSLDEVVNDPIVKNKAIGYYKLHKWVWRGCEAADLERQWNRGAE
jgi:hypothetical protein